MTQEEDPLQREIEGLLPRWIPPLVHRLNNSLAVIHGALQGSTEVRDRAAGREFETARSLLRQLSLLVKTPPPRTEELELSLLVAGIAELVRPSLEVERIDLVLPKGAVPVRADPSRLGKLLAFLVGRVLAGPPDAGRGETKARARLALRVGTGWATLSGVREHPPDGTTEAPALRAIPWAEELGARLSVRDTKRCHAWRLALPCLVAQPSPAAPRRPRRRVVLCVPEASLAELLVLVLGHEGFEITLVDGPERFSPSEEGLFLLDADAYLGRPAELGVFLERWSAPERLVLIGGTENVPRDGIARLEKPFRPGELLSTLEGMRAK